jgi:hypothetical protein
LLLDPVVPNKAHDASISITPPRHSGQRAFGALIRNLAELKKIPGSPLRGAPE